MWYWGAPCCPLTWAVTWDTSQHPPILTPGVLGFMNGVFVAQWFFDGRGENLDCSVLRT